MVDTVENETTGITEPTGPVDEQQNLPLASGAITEEQQIEADRKFKLRMLEACGKVEEATAKHEDAKARAAAAKKTYEAAVAEMVAAAQPSLFDGLKETDAKPSDSDDWESVDIIELDLPIGLDKSLRDATPPLATLGAIAEWARKENELVDIPGVGKQKAETIQLAIDKYWEDHPLAAEGSDDEGAEPTEAE